MDGIKVESDWKNKTALISYTPLEEQVFLLKQGLELAFRFRWTLPSGRPSHEAKITQKAFAELKSDQLVSYKDLGKFIFQFNNFLCLAHDKPLALTHIEAYRDDLFEEVDGKKRYIPLEIFYQSIPHPEIPPKIESFNLLFSFDIISENLGEVISKWYESYELLQPAFNLYFAATGTKDLFLDNKFLFLVQGLETMHRRTTQKACIPHNEFENLVSNFLKICPENHKNWLRGKLAYANEISLRQRLGDSIAADSVYFGGEENVKKLINDVVTTRNYLTHFDISLEDKAANGEGLLHLYWKLEVLFEIHLLRMIGLS